MLNKEDIIKELTTDTNFVDKFILDAFIKNWKIEAIYEDENGVEFFDEVAFEKIKKALGPKEPEKELYTVEEVKKEDPVIEPSIEKSEEDIPEPVVEKVVEKPFVETVIKSSEEPKKAEVLPVNVENKNQVLQKDIDMKNFTLDITNQTLTVLAESIAQKITVDISQYLKNNELLEQAIETGEFKKDNEILSKKLNEVLSDNKVLIKRIQELEAETGKYINVFGNIYVKKSK